MGEFGYIGWLRGQTPPDPRIPIGPGDDAAGVAFRPGRMPLVTSDLLMDGRHFILADAGPRAVARKAMAVNLSDIAAMAGEPIAAILSVALPASGGRALAEELYRGFREVADEFGTALAGGDTNTWDGPLVICVTLLGEAGEYGPVRRSGARAGDWLMVTGPLGGSILGKHLEVIPRIREAQQLRRFVELHAMIDLSDGLAGDLRHICAESHCGAVLEAQAIPINRAAIHLSERDGRSPLEHALTDGEDFELLFAVSPVDGQRLLDDQPIAGVTLSKVGECAEGEGLWLDDQHRRVALAVTGYEHDLSDDHESS